MLAAPRAVIEETPVVAEAVEGEAGAVAEPEVIGRGKEDEEGEEDEPCKKGGIQEGRLRQEVAIG